MTMRHSALLACRSPDRLRRCRCCLPLDASSGAAPQSRAKDRSLRIRLAFSPAATRSAPAVSVPTPTRSIISGAVSATSGVRSSSRCRISSSSSRMRRASVLSATRFALVTSVRPAGSEPGGGAHQLRDREATELGAEFVGSGGDDRTHLVQRPGAVPRGAAASQSQHPDRFDVAVAGLRHAERVTRERGPRRADRVVRVRLAGTSSPLPVRSIDLDHRRSPPTGADGSVPRRSCRSPRHRPTPRHPNERSQSASSR